MYSVCLEEAAARGVAVSNYDEVFRQIERNPFNALNAPYWIRQAVERLRDQYSFFHWQLSFPDVFQVAYEETEDTQTVWSSGFNVVLGNSPWEIPETDGRIFFAIYRPDITAEDLPKSDALS